MSWVAVAVAGSAIVGGVLGSNAAKSAANTQAAAARDASQVQLDMFQQTQKNLQPYMAEGQLGLDQISRLMQDPSFVSQLPGYQFQLKQGQDAILNTAAAGGLTGNTLRSLDQFGQGLASTNLNNFWNQGMQLANLGQTSAAGVGNIGAATGNSIASNMIGAGNAQAAGQVGAATAYSNAINSGINNWMMYQALQGGG